MDDPAVITVEDPLPKEHPPDTVLDKPTNDNSNSEADHCGEILGDEEPASLEIPAKALQESPLTPTREPSGEAVIVEAPSVVAPPLGAEPLEPSADGSEERGWLHRDLLSNTETVPLGFTPDLVGSGKELAVEEENCDKPNSPGCVLDPSAPDVPSALSELQSQTEEAKSSDAVSVKSVDGHSSPSSTNQEGTSKQLVEAQHSLKTRSTSFPNRTNSLEAKKNRLQDILNAKTKDLSMSAQNQISNPKLLEIRGPTEKVEKDRGCSSLVELPPNTEIIRPSLVAPSSEAAVDGDRESRTEIANDDSNLIINKPVTQIMAKSKRKAKKPLPNRSSLESMIDAASDLTDFFSIANTLDDSEGDDVLVVNEGAEPEPASSSVAETPKDRPSPDVSKPVSVIKSPETSKSTQQNVTTISISDVCASGWVPKHGNAPTTSQPTSAGTVNVIHTIVTPPPNPQVPTTPTSVTLQQPATPETPTQLGQPTHFIQQVVQSQQPQLSLLQQKLIQPLQPGNLLPQGQILVQGNVVQGSILQTGLTSVGGMQQSGSTGNIIVQSAQQAPQQFVPVQQVPVGSPVIQQTAVLPPVYQGQLPIIQQQTAQQLPIASGQQTSSTIFTCSSPTPTVIKPQQTVFLLQRGDTLKIDSHGNLIVIGKEGQDNTGQMPIIQPGSSILPVNTVKNLLNARQQCDTSVPQDLARTSVGLSTAQRSVFTGTAMPRGTAMQVNRTNLGQMAIGSFNRPVVIGKQPVASVQPQRQKSSGICPNPELQLIPAASSSSGPELTSTPTGSVDVTVVKSESTTTLEPPTSSSKGGIKIFQCEKCKKLFVSKASLFNHLAAEMHTNNIPEHVKLPYKCTVCEAHFAFKASLTFHKNRPCLPDKPVFNIICSICKLRFKALIDLERHVVRCHHLLPGQNPEFVDKDPEEKREAISLPGGAKIWSKAIPSTLADNPAAKRWKEIAQRPIESRLDVKPQILTSIVKPTEVTEGSNPDQPPIKVVMSVKRKKKSKHRSKKRRRSSAERSKSASRCAATVVKDADANTRNLINTHGRFLCKSPRPFSCKICNKGFTSEHCLLEHIKTHIRPFRCSLCGWKSARKDNVLKHIQLQHDGPEYRRKRASPLKSHRALSSTEDEEEYLEEVEGEVKTAGAEEDDVSDPEAAEIELDDDDMPNDYFGSGKYHKDDENSDDDNSGGRNSKTDKKGSDKQVDTSATNSQGNDDTSTPVPQDHNYLTQMQLSSDSTDPILESEGGTADANLPNQVDATGSRVSVSASSSCIADSQLDKECCIQSEACDSRQSPLDGTEIAEQDNETCESTASNKATERNHLNDDLKAEVNSSESSLKRGPELETERVKPCSSQDPGSDDSPVTSLAEDTSIPDPETNHTRSGDSNSCNFTSTEQSSDLCPDDVTEITEDGSLNDNCTTSGESFPTDVAKLKECGDDVVTQTHFNGSIDNTAVSNPTELQNEELPTQTSTNDSSEILPADSCDTSVNCDNDNEGKDKCLPMLAESDLDSDGDILEWTTTEHDSDEESVLPEEDGSEIQQRPILLRDEEESRAESPSTLDESVIIDEDNLEIRAKHPGAPDQRPPSGIGDSTYQAVEADSPDAYYTVLDAEGSDGEPQEEGGVTVMDGNTEEKETDDFLSVGCHTTEVAEVEFREGEDDSSLADVTHVQAKCNIDPDVRVKTEYCTPYEADANGTYMYVSERFDSNLPEESDHVVGMDEEQQASEIDIPNQMTWAKPQPPREKEEMLTNGTLQVKQELVDLGEEEPQVLGVSQRKAASPQYTTQATEGLCTSGSVDSVRGQPKMSRSPFLQKPTEDRLGGHNRNEPASEQVLPVISAVGSLRETADRLEGVNHHPRKSVILEALNRPSQQFPPQQFGPPSPGYDPRAMYGPLGVPMVDPSTGQPYLPRYPHPGNPYLSMFHSGSLVDPREQYYPGPHPPSAMHYGHRPPHAGPSLPESRFPSPNCYPLAMNRVENPDYQGLDKHRLGRHKMHPDKHQWEKEKHQHLRRRLQERQHYYPQNGYPPHGHPESNPTFPSDGPVSSQRERFLFPKYPYEDRAGGHSVINPVHREPSDAVMNPSSQYYKANSRRQLSEGQQPLDLQSVPVPREYGEMCKQPIRLEQNSTQGAASHPMGNPYAPAAHIPGRPPIPAEAPIPTRASAPALRPGITGDTNGPQMISESNGISLPSQASNGLPNDKPPPLVYQGPQKPEDLTLQKSTEDKSSDIASKEHSVEDSRRKISADVVEVSGDDENAVQFSELADVPQNNSDVASPREGTQPFSKPAPPPPPPPPQGPPPPPPPPLPLHSLYADKPSRLHYSPRESIETISHPPLAHQHHSEYLPGTAGSFVPPPIHVGPSHISPKQPSPKSVTRSPKRRHSSSGSADQQKSPRRRKRSKTDENPEERPYACHICGNRFKRSNNLTDHVRIHSRPYKCGECSFDTTRWQYLADHLKRNHNFEGDARELEMMFKSGKRLKPTDHIPETCYQPLPGGSNTEGTSAHPVRNGFSPGSRSMVVPSSTIILPRGSDIVHRDKKAKRRRGDDDQDEDLVDFFGLAANQDDEDSTVIPVTLSEVSPKEELDDVASGSANGSQISPGSTQAQTSPKESPITSPKPEALWSKRKQLIPCKVIDEDLTKENSNPDFKTPPKTSQENGDVNYEYDLMVNRMEDQIREEGEKEELKHEVEETEINVKQEDIELTEEHSEGDAAMDEIGEEEKEGGSLIDASDQEYSTTYQVASKDDAVDDSDEEAMYTPTGRPKRKTGNYTFQGKPRRLGENEDPEYKPNRQRPWKKKRGIMLKIHIKRGKKRGRPRHRQVSEPSGSQVQALSTHIGGGLDLTPYYAIVETTGMDLDHRPYQCKINECNKRFKSKQHMREHLFTHLKPYKCDGCGVGFARTDYLAMHMRDMHKMSPTRADLYNKRKCANGRAMACRMRPSKDRRRQELQQSFQNGKEL